MYKDVREASNPSSDGSEEFMHDPPQDRDFKDVSLPTSDGMPPRTVLVVTLIVWRSVRPPISAGMFPFATKLQANVLSDVQFGARASRSQMYSVRERQSLHQHRVKSAH